MATASPLQAALTLNGATTCHHGYTLDRTTVTFWHRGTVYTVEGLGSEDWTHTHIPKETCATLNANTHSPLTDKNWSDRSLKIHAFIFVCLTSQEIWTDSFSKSANKRVRVTQKQQKDIKLSLKSEQDNSPIYRATWCQELYTLQPINSFPVFKNSTLDCWN